MSEKQEMYSFQEALFAIKEGLTVCRNGCNNRIFMMENKDKSISVIMFKCLITDFTNRYDASSEDLLATDWKIFK